MADLAVEARHQNEWAEADLDALPYSSPPAQHSIQAKNMHPDWVALHEQSRAATQSRVDRSLLQQESRAQAGINITARVYVRVRTLASSSYSV